MKQHLVFFDNTVLVSIDDTTVGIQANAHQLNMIAQSSTEFALVNANVVGNTTSNTTETSFLKNYLVGEHVLTNPSPNDFLACQAISSTNLNTSVNSGYLVPYKKVTISLAQGYDITDQLGFAVNISLAYNHPTLSAINIALTNYYAQFANAGSASYRSTRYENITYVESFSFYIVDIAKLMNSADPGNALLLAMLQEVTVDVSQLTSYTCNIAKVLSNDITLHQYACGPSMVDYTFIAPELEESNYILTNNVTLTLTNNVSQEHDRLKIALVPNLMSIEQALAELGDITLTSVNHVLTLSEYNGATLLSTTSHGLQNMAQQYGDILYKPILHAQTTELQIELSSEVYNSGTGRFVQLYDSLVIMSPEISQLVNAQIAVNITTTQIVQQLVKGELQPTAINAQDYAANGQLFTNIPQAPIKKVKISNTNNTFTQYANPGEEVILANVTLQFANGSVIVPMYNSMQFTEALSLLVAGNYIVLADGTLQLI